jgi:PAS domain S-box-containing protein
MGKRNDIVSLYNVSLSVGQSLELHEMLRSSLGSFTKELDLFGSAVFFFKVNPDKKIFFEKVLASPDDSSCEADYLSAVNNLPSFEMKEMRAFENALPRIGNSDNGIFYHLFNLANIGVLVLLTKDEALEGDLIAKIKPLADKLSFACTVCIRKIELEMESKGTKSILHDLSEYDDVLLNTIIETRKARDDLNESRNRLALILQSLGEGIVAVDQNGNITLINVRALEYLDYMPDTRNGLTVDKIFTNCAGGIPDLVKNIENIEGENLFAEITVKGNHGVERYLRILPNKLKGLLVGEPEVIYLIQNISREKEIDRIKNDFISNLSHELRTPMNAILGISKILLTKGSDNLSDRQREGLSIINDSGKRLLALINDILDLSKIEAGKMELRESVFFLSDLTKHIQGVVNSLNMREITFSIAVDESAPISIFADENRLQQVLVNLLGNSIKFTEHGSVSLVISASNEKMHFSVRDTGIGIPTEEIPRVFDRFNQVDGSSSRKYEGTGIGLPLSREIVRLMGGEITVESEQGVGTTVRFFIPLRKEYHSVRGDDNITDSDSENEKHSNSKPGNRQRILVAEDEESERKIFSYLLSDRYDLVFARNGKEACAMFAAVNPDLVLMDISMPEMDGILALERIRSDEVNKNIPVIAVTARAMKGEKEKILGYGFNSYISKPIDEELLIKVMHSLLK